MAVLKTLRTATQCPPSGVHPYIDTPDFTYAGSAPGGAPVGWLDHLLANNDQPIGTVTGNPLVAVIGGGISGLCAGYELIRAGCGVVVFEQGGDVGGRCASQALGVNDIAEMGSMRFPPTEFILDFYLKKLGLVPGGLCNLPDFPDPGKQLTYVCYGADVQTWIGPNAPAGFETVANGWNAFMSKGLSIAGNLTLQPVGVITTALASGQIDQATQYWQAYINAFGQKTFYTALYEIFTGSGGYDIPGGTPWTVQDFDKFGELGLGSGGFGPLYPIGFVEIYRLIVNELETTQKFLTPTSTFPYGIRSLALALAGNIGPLLPIILPPTSQGAISLNTPISAISRQGSGFVLTGPDNAQFGPFARVIVATTTRAMELNLNLTAPVVDANQKPLISRDAAVAIMRTHLVASNKVAARINNFWANNTNAVRCLQTDSLVHQVYTLDYTPAGQPESGTGICFISYVWDDDAVKQQAITSGAPTGAGDNQLIYDYLLATLQATGGDVASWAAQLTPVNNDYQNNVIFEEWQSSPYFAGAFKLSEPGQDPYVQTMFFDYLKCLDPAIDTGVYLAGDCISWTSGWVEGGLTAGLNAAAAVIQSLGGTLNPDPSNHTPLTINPQRYAYF